MYHVYYTLAVLLITIASISADIGDVEMKCTPKAKFKFYCNTCWCSEEGTMRICTKKYCPDDIFNKDGTLKSPPNVHLKMQQITKGIGDIEQQQ